MSMVEMPDGSFLTRERPHNRPGRASFRSPNRRTPEIRLSACCPCHVDVVREFKRITRWRVLRYLIHCGYSRKVDPHKEVSRRRRSFELAGVLLRLLDHTSGYVAVPPPSFSCGQHEDITRWPLRAEGVVNSQFFCLVCEPAWPGPPETRESGLLHLPK